MPYEPKAHRLVKEMAQIYVEQITPLADELKNHQKKCKHRKAVKEYGADSGNWCPQDDCYWANIFCPTCLKEWTVESDSPEYRMYIDVRQLRFKNLAEYKKEVGLNAYRVY